MSIRTAAAHRNLLYLLSMRELRTRYKRSLLGWMWSLLNPLVQMAIFSVIFLYVSYVIPALLGLRAYGRTWTQMGPFQIGGLFRLTSALCALGCLLLIAIGIQPPNDKALWIVLSTFVLAAVTWFGFERRRFSGPPGIGI